MAEAKRIAVLGSFLGSEWFELWQRQQEFTTRLMGVGNVVYVERAAGGTITPSRVLGRLKNMARRSDRVRPDVARSTPTFVHWLQIPSSRPQAIALNAERVVRSIRKEFGGGGPDFVYVGAPTEVWAAVLERLGVPYWFDMPERFLHSETYATVDRKAMRTMVQSALLVTVDTRTSLDDWAGVRDDIVLIPHGSKDIDFEPDWNAPRRHFYYVGSMNPAVDVTFFSTLAKATGADVRIIGRAHAGEFGRGTQAMGWLPGHDIPRALSDAVAGVVPYRLDDFTAGVLPTKIYDYFLAGAPAISSMLPSLEGHFGVYLVDGSLGAMREAVERARSLSVEQRQELRDYARRNDWSDRFGRVVRELAARGVDFVDNA